jgi:SNF2 family DNA or RNA helicase
MRKCKQVKKALIICPLSTMERTWADEIFKTFPHLDTQVLYGSRERRQKLLREEAHLYIINIDGLKTIEDDLKKRDDIDLLIIDEVAMFRNGTTNRWKTMNAIANKQTNRRIWALTGMPTPNAPTDAWAQCKLVNPNATNVPAYFTKARDALMKQISPFKWEARVNANDVIKEWMQPAIRYSLDDCTDLPPQTFMSRDVTMSDEQKKAYKEMLSKLKTEYEGGEVLAVNEAVKANKLVQIACGMAYAADGSTIAIPCNHRIEVLREVIEESEGKVIVFVPAPALIIHPVGTVQLYVVAFGTDAIEYVCPDVDGQRLTNPEIDPGVAGVPFPTVTDKEAAEEVPHELPEVTVMFPF